MKKFSKPLLVYAHRDNKEERIERICESFHETLDCLSIIWEQNCTHEHLAKKLFDAAISTERLLDNHGYGAKERLGMEILITYSKERLPYNEKNENKVYKINAMRIVRKPRGWYLVSAGSEIMWHSCDGHPNHRITMGLEWV